MFKSKMIAHSREISYIPIRNAGVKKLIISNMLIFISPRNITLWEDCNFDHTKLHKNYRPESCMTVDVFLSYSMKNYVIHLYSQNRTQLFQIKMLFPVLF